MSDKCCYCETSTKELRPYGPKGAWVCFECAMATPEREAEAQKQFGSQVDASGPVAVLDGKNGPVPVKHSRIPDYISEGARSALEELHPGIFNNDH